MYSVVLLAALGGNVTVPACDWGRGYRCYDDCYRGGWGCGCWGGYSCGWGGGYYYDPCVYASSYYAPYASWSYATPAVADVSGKSPATIVVNLPADARLKIEGEPTRSTSGQRTFVSPPISPGSAFYYTLQADLDRNGEKSTVTKQVEVRAGQMSQVTIEFPTRTAMK